MDNEPSYCLFSINSAFKDVYGKSDVVEVKMRGTVFQLVGEKLCMWQQGKKEPIKNYKWTGPATRDSVMRMRHWEWNPGLIEANAKFPLSSVGPGFHPRSLSPGILMNHAPSIELLSGGNGSAAYPSALLLLSILFTYKTSSGIWVSFRILSLGLILAPMWFSGRIKGP